MTLVDRGPITTRGTTGVKKLIIEVSWAPRGIPIDDFQPPRNPVN